MPVRLLKQAHGRHGQSGKRGCLALREAPLAKLRQARDETAGMQSLLMQAPRPMPHNAKSVSARRDGIQRGVKAYQAEQTRACCRSHT